MTHIKITPAELRQAADTLTEQARVIEERVADTGRIIDRAIADQAFAGNRANALINRYHQKQQIMEAWPGSLTAFATKLRETADRFETADRAQDGQTYGAPTSAPSSAAGTANSSPYANMSAEELNAKTDALAASMKDKWTTIKDKLRSLTLEAAGAVIAAMLTGGTSTAITAALAGVGIAGSDDIGEIISAWQGIEADRKSYVDIGMVQFEQQMHAGFDSNAELNDLQANWSKIQQDGVNMRLEIMKNFSGGGGSIVDQMLMALNPVGRIAGMAATYDDYFEMWIGNEQRVAQADAYLKAIELRRAGI